MKRSTARILTSHVGSLARADSLIPLLRLREKGQPNDREELACRVRKQVEAGIDIVTDGEQGKSSFYGYVVERFSGFERKPAAPGNAVRPRSAGREYLAFPDYYAWCERIAEPFGGRGGGRGHGVDTCTGSVSYKGHGRPGGHHQPHGGNRGPHPRGRLHACDRVFLRRGYFCQRILPHPRGVRAGPIRRDAREYKAIVDAGFILQIDDPRLVTYYMMQPELSVADCTKWAAERVEVINDSIRDIPPEKVRFHTCYSIDVGPHIHEMALKDIVDIILKINAGAYSLEAANPRHEHEYHVFEQVKLPADKILIPGVISHTTNLVEHPELVAERIVRFAKMVGRENVIAGADCGFAASALRFNDTHPSVAWLKFAALAEGARLATRQLWN